MAKLDKILNLIAGIGLALIIFVIYGFFGLICFIYLLYGNMFMRIASIVMIILIITSAVLTFKIIKETTKDDN